MIPQDTVNLILDTARIEDVIGDFVTLKRRGSSYVACCPFHNEKTPSFNVSPSKGIYKCFGCGKAGTAVGFVMEHEHYSYAEALRYLARKYNIEIIEKDETAEDIAARQHNESLLLASEFAGKFFASSLDSTEGKSIARAYFKMRGLEDRTIARYGLGWAPRGKSAFTDAARAAGYKPEYLLETGLCAQREDGSLYDRFYDRVIFPIHSVSGRVIAFGGRTLRSDYKEAGLGKYVNSKESEIYVKSRSLYGIYFAKSEISRADRCYLVEGYLDVLSMHQLGITNVVASSGTSLTVEQVRLIKKFTDNITIMYDGDAAGIHAALRGIGLVLAEGMNVRILLLPDGDDPDSYSRKHTLQEVQDFIAANERDFIGFKTDLLLQEAAGDPVKKADLINDIADTIALIPDAVKRSVYIEDCAMKFNIESKILFERMMKTHKVQLPDASETAPAGPGPEMLQENRTLAKAEQDLLGFLISYGCDPLEFSSDSPFYCEGEPCTVADFIRESLEADATSFANTAYRKTYDAYFEAYDAGRNQEEILRGLVNSTDLQVSGVAVSLSTQRYQLTVRSFEDALTTTASWLVAYVPRSILYYNERRLQDEIDRQKKALATADPQEQTRILELIMKLQGAQRKVRQQMGREKTRN